MKPEYQEYQQKLNRFNRWELDQLQQLGVVEKLNQFFTLFQLSQLYPPQEREKYQQQHLATLVQVQQDLKNEARRTELTERSKTHATRNKLAESAKSKTRRRSDETCIKNSMCPLQSFAPIDRGKLTLAREKSDGNRKQEEKNF